ncbi:DUF1194 domain-containing protein [Rhodobacteraceae bacterium NNCM2]|nr:DUF1194 domain-containing protein [Coraliihabitans acroporae]
MRLLAALLCLVPGPALACALELILATDVSGSIDQQEYALQANGLATAFRDERLINAIAEMEGGLIITHFQWSGASRQGQVTPWRHLTDAASIHAYSAELSATDRLWRNFSTAIGEALRYAGAISAEAPLACKRRVIDVSGDGISNEGQPPRVLADRLAAQGFTVNALVIRGAEPDPVDHFQHEVIAGPGAFLEIATGFEDYPAAILRKLLREIDPPLLTSGLGQP